MAYVLSSLVLLIGIFLAWFVGAMLQLNGVGLLLSRVVFVLIGIVGAVLILWMHFRNRRTASATPAGPTNTGDLDTLLRDASAKLSSAQRTGPKSFNSLPLLYVLGDDNSGKTTTILKSSLDPELLFSDTRQPRVTSTACAQGRSLTIGPRTSAKTSFQSRSKLSDQRW